MPSIWQMLEHDSWSVSYETYKDLADKGAKSTPHHCPVVCLADHGFAAIDQVRHLQRLAWQWRIRSKSSFCIKRRRWVCQSMWTVYTESLSQQSRFGARGTIWKFMLVRC